MNGVEMEIELSNVGKYSNRNARARWRFQEKYVAVGFAGSNFRTQWAILCSHDSMGE